MGGEENENNMENMATSVYYKKAQKKLKAWEDLRNEVLKRTFQFVGLFPCLCVSCGKEDSPYRCQDCTHYGTFCEQCMLNAHNTINLFHNVEVIKVY